MIQKNRFCKVFLNFVGHFGTLHGRFFSWPATVLKLKNIKKTFEKKLKVEDEPVPGGQEGEGFESSLPTGARL